MEGRSVCHFEGNHVKKLLIVLVLLGIGAVGVAYLLNNRAQATTLPPRVEKVERGDILEKAPSTGKTYPREFQQVATDVAVARVVDIDPAAQVGKIVAKDQVLVRLDDEIARSKVTEAQAAVKLAEASKAQAEASLAKAQAGQRQAERVQELAKHRYELVVKQADQVSATQRDDAEKAFNAAKEGVNIGVAQVKEAEAGISTAEANIAKANAALSAAQQLLSYYVIKAPIAGTIMEKRVNKGQLVSPQLTPVLFVITPDPNEIDLQAQVAEADISKIKIGMEARFSVDAYADEGPKFRAVVDFIPRMPNLPTARGLEGLPGLGGGGIPSQLSGPVYYTVTLNVKPYDGMERKPLLYGMTANVDFIVREVKNALKVSNQALLYRPERIEPELAKQIDEKSQAGWRTVWRYENGKERVIFVRTGASDGSKTEITQVDGDEKLDVGMEVVTEPAPAPEGGGIFNVSRSLRLG